MADARRLLDAVDVICALTLDAMAGTDAAFDPAVHAARPHPGQGVSAARLLDLLVGSEIRESHRECGRVQDAYSLRCSPQVHGAGRDALEHAHRVLEIELNSATDNPMVFAEGRLISGGNFHGAPIAAVFDYLATTLTDAAGTYSFAGLEPGTYCVSVDSLGATNETILIPGSWTYPSDEGQATVSVGAGESSMGVNFGWDFQFLP